MDPAACAPSVKHDPVENPAYEDSGAVFGRRLMVNLWCRVHHFGHLMENVWVVAFRCRVDHLGDHGVGRCVGLCDFIPRIGDLRQEIFRVRGVLPVAVEVRDIAVGPVISRLT